jgi:hypothetical protein
MEAEGAEEEEGGYVDVDVDVLLLIDDMSPTGMLMLDGRVHVTDTFDKGGGGGDDDGDRGQSHYYYRATNGVVRAIGGVAYAIDGVLLPDDVEAAMTLSGRRPCSSRRRKCVG